MHYPAHSPINRIKMRSSRRAKGSDKPEEKVKYNTSDSVWTCYLAAKIWRKMGPLREKILMAIRVGLAFGLILYNLGLISKKLIF